MSQIFYARKNGEKLETVEEHCKKVSKMAGEYTDKFTHKSIGQLLGFLHDIGKNTDMFQNVLSKKENNVNHAIMSGILLGIEGCAELFETDTKYTEIFSNICSAHHSELKYFKSDMLIPSEWDTLFYGKKYSVSSDEEFKRLLKLVSESIKNGNIKTLKHYFEDEGIENELDIMLYTRMIFSCLVDADYNCSALFFNENYMSETEKEIDLDFSIQALYKKRKEILSATSQNNPINHIRNYVFDTCSITQELPYLNSKNSRGGCFSLTSPTGSGKTLATLIFALSMAKKYNKTRIFIVPPFLSITSQTSNVLEEIFGKEYVLEDDTLMEMTSKNEKELASKWSAPFVVPTSVKFLESLFSNDARSCRKLHNICNSVIIFDEYQSIPPHLLGVTMNTLRELAKRYGCIILFTSATPPNFSFRKDIKWWSDEVLEIIPDVERLYKEYEQIKKINVHWEFEKQTTHEDIAKRMVQYSNCAIVCNTRKTAKRFYKKFIKIKNKDECFFISSDLCPQHKKEIIDKIKIRQALSLPTYVISTQCIEAGIDISFNCIFRELAPLESIIQLSGRCVRNCDICGDLFIISFEEDRNPNINYRNAKAQTQNLFIENGNFININDLSQLNSYYEKLYTLNHFNKDSSELLNAIVQEDFVSVKKHYKVIDNNEQIKIVVPYVSQLSLYKTILDELHCNGVVDMKYIKKIQGITVSTFNKNIQNACKPLLFSTKKHPEGIDLGFYILIPNTLGVSYDDKMGLEVNDESLIL